MGRLVPLIFSLLAHGYIGLRIVLPLMLWPWAAISISLLLAFSSVLMPLGLFSRRRAAPPAGKPDAAQAIVWAGLVCMGLFSSLFVLTLIRDVALAAAALAGHWWPGLVDAAGVRVASAAMVPLCAIIISTIGFRNARGTATVVHVDVPIAGLPSALHGFTIAQVTDVHVGPTIRKPFVDAIVAVVNRLDADMVAITGDLVDGSVAELSRHVAPLADLSSRHGTFFVTGNHEYYSGAHAWIGALRHLGMSVLMNEHVVLQHGAASLVVAGVADTGAHHFDPSHRSDPNAAIAGAPPEASVRLLLAHQPRSASAAAAAGFDLQLSGHTHGGQFLPWNFFVRLQQPFTAGLHRLENLWVYTSRGTGYWGPPKRFGAPSEITFLRLVPSPAT